MNENKKTPPITFSQQKNNKSHDFISCQAIATPLRKAKIIVYPMYYFNFTLAIFFFSFQEVVVLFARAVQNFCARLCINGKSLE